MKHTGLLLSGVFLLLLVSEHTFALTKAFTLPELVQMSSLIARVKVVSTQEFNRKEHRRYRSVATINVLEVFRGALKTESIRLRFDNGADCPNVHYSAGEERMVFAVRDIDGTYSTVNYEFGKKKIDTKNYRSLITRVKALSAKYAFEVSIAAIDTTEQTPRLKITITNKGEERISIANDLRVDMRDTRADQVCGRSPEYGLPVTLVFQSGGVSVAKERVQREDGLRPLGLRSSETCTATVPVRDLFLGVGKTTLKVWAKVGGRLSDPITVTVDFGRAEKARALSEEILEPLTAPFKKVSERE